VKLPHQPVGEQKKLLFSIKNFALATYATKEYEVKPISVFKDNEEHIVYLIAVYSYNKLTNTSGFVLYSTADMKKWDIREATPLIDTLFFASEEEAFIMGEIVLRMGERQLSGKTDQLPNPYPYAPQSA